MPNVKIFETIVFWMQIWCSPEPGRNYVYCFIVTIDYWTKSISLWSRYWNIVLVLLWILLLALFWYKYGKPILMTESCRHYFAHFKSLTPIGFLFHIFDNFSTCFCCIIECVIESLTVGLYLTRIKANIFKSGNENYKEMLSIWMNNQSLPRYINTLTLKGQSSLEICT